MVGQLPRWERGECWVICELVGSLKFASGPDIVESSGEVGAGDVVTKAVVEVVELKERDIICGVWERVVSFDSDDFER